MRWDENEKGKTWGYVRVSTAMGRNIARKGKTWANLRVSTEDQDLEKSRTAILRLANQNEIVEKPTAGRSRGEIGDRGSVDRAGVVSSRAIPGGGTGGSQHPNGQGRGRVRAERGLPIEQRRRPKQDDADAVGTVLRDRTRLDPPANPGGLGTRTAERGKIGPSSWFHLRQQAGRPGRHNSRPAFARLSGSRNRTGTGREPYHHELVYSDSTAQTP